MSTTDIDTGITAEELNAVIEEAPKGATLTFKAADYRFDDAIDIHRSDISLVGAGEGETTLTFSDKALDRNDDYAIRIMGEVNGVTVGSLDSSIDEGEERLNLASGHGLESGDTVRIWQDNDEAFFNEIGDTSWRKQQYAELRTSMAKVESVDGDSVTLDRGVHFDFDQGKAQIERIEPVENVSVEGFSVEYELGTPSASAFNNAQQDLTGYKAIFVDGAARIALDDIAVENGPSTAFHFSRSLDAEVDSISANGAFNKGNGGNGYAYELKESYDGTFTGLEDTGMRHGLLFASWRSSVGNDIEVDFTDRDINFHGGRDHGNQVRVEQAVRNSESDELSPSLWVNAGGESFGAITDSDANEVRFDYVKGSRRSDEIQASDEGAYLNGGLGHDTLIGGDGHDVLQGGPGDAWYDGNDRLVGGKGIDTALYTQDSDDYDISFTGEQVKVRSDKGSNDILEDIEYAAFGDGTLLHIASRRTFQTDPLEIPTASDILDDNAIPSPLADDETELLVTGGTTHSWSDGYIAEIFVENVSDKTIDTPEIRLDLSDGIDTLWNGDVSREDGAYRIKDDNARELAPGEAWRFAYKAYGDEESPDSVSGMDGLDVELLGMNTSSDVDAFA